MSYFAGFSGADTLEPPAPLPPHFERGRGVGVVWMVRARAGLQTGDKAQRREEKREMYMELNLPPEYQQRAEIARAVSSERLERGLRRSRADRWSFVRGILPSSHLGTAQADRA